jgi:hypothetical protein
MKCPLCEIRKAKRFCPAKGRQICAVCCGTKREVEIDCPSDCVYLHVGREYESEKIARSGEMPPRTERLWEHEFISRHYGIFLSVWGIILDERARFPEMVDGDVQMTLDSLIRTYETMDKGIYYDSTPASAVQKNLYRALKAFFESSNQEFDISSGRLKTSTILDCLRFQRELALAIVLPRPKSRAFLDHLQDIHARSFPEVREEPRIILP